MARGRKEKLHYPLLREMLSNMGTLDFTIEEMGLTLGVHPDTVRGYMKRHPEIVVQVDSARRSSKLNLKVKAYKMAMAGNVEMLKFVLDKMTDWKIKPDLNVNLSGQFNFEANIQEVLFANLPSTDSDIESRIERIRRSGSESLAEKDPNRVRLLLQSSGITVDSEN